MSAIIQTVIEMVYDAINTQKGLSAYVSNDFTLSKTFLPIGSLGSDITTNGTVWVMGLARDDTKGSRGKFQVSDQPIRIAIQALITDTSDIDEIYPWCELDDQIRDTIADSVNDANLTWLRHQALKDENETPYNYVKLREGSVFESYFDSYFRVNTVRP